MKWVMGWLSFVTSTVVSSLQRLLRKLRTALTWVTGFFTRTKKASPKPSASPNSSHKKQSSGTKRRKK